MRTNLLADFSERIVQVCRRPAVHADDAVLGVVQIGVDAVIRKIAGRVIDVARCGDLVRSVRDGQLRRGRGSAVGEQVLVVARISKLFRNYCAIPVTK